MGAAGHVHLHVNNSAGNTDKDPHGSLRAAAAVPQLLRCQAKPAHSAWELENRAYYAVQLSWDMMEHGPTQAIGLQRSRTCTSSRCPCWGQTTAPTRPSPLRQAGCLHVHARASCLSLTLYTHTVPVEPRQ